MAHAGTRPPALQWPVYGHLWLALGVGAQVAWTGSFVRDVEGLPALACAAALGTFAAYGFMRWARAQDADLAASPHLAWIRTHQRVLLPLWTAAALAALWCVWPFQHDTLLWGAAIVAITALYVLPVRIGQGAAPGLRRIPLLKSLLIAATAALTTVALPMQLALDAPATADVLLYVCMRIPFFLAIAIAFDVRDVAFDPPALRTFPQVMGVGGARTLAVLLALLAAGFEHVFLRNLGYAEAAWTVLVGHAVTVLLVAFASPRRGPLYFGVLLDGMLAFVPLCGWVGTLL